MSSGLVLNTNINSLVAQNALTSSGTQLASALEQLSTGLRINTAADDAAGYAIVNGMTSQINGLNQAAQNANDGVSLAQTASGALSEVVNDLQSMRDLAVESLNATNSSSDRDDLDAQFQQLKNDINSVASQTQFNGVNLLDGTFQGATFQTGANAGQSITMAAIASAKSSALGNYYNGTLSLAGTVTTAAGGTPITTTAGTAGNYNSSTLAGADGLNTAVDGSSVTLGVEVNGTNYQTGAITLTGDQTTDLETIAAAVNQALSPAGGLVATVNSAGTGLQVSGTATPGTGSVVNFSVASAESAGDAAVTPGADTLAALGLDSSDIIGSYTTTGSAGTAASVATALTSGGTAGAYDAATLATDLDGTGSIAGTGTPGVVTLSVSVNGGTAQTTGDIDLIGTKATDLASIATALNTVFGGDGLTAAAGANGVTITGSNADATVSFSVASATAADGTTVTPSAGLLTAMGVDSGDTVTYTPAVPAVTAGTYTSSATQYVSGLNVQSVDSSNLVLISIDEALQQLATTGADLGAYQNRFQAAVTGLQTDSTNLSSARSQIQDTDYAQATSQLTQAQILQQAGTAMVAQANTIPQNVLTLLNHLS
ncbi:MAG TPA: flagellin [Steroidobacteraceae bacterium]|nr:flagellin [Steroidobacteraceae bacterium]